MGDNGIVLRVQTVNGHPPEVTGLDVVEGEWRLAVAQHRELLVDVTGVELTADPDLQTLATIAARLEGYVESERQQSGQTHRPPRQVESPNQRLPVVGSWLASLLRRFLSSLFDAPIAPGHRSVGATATETQYDVHRVYQLSQFFRAMVEARKDRITAGTPKERSVVGADQSQE